MRSASQFVIWLCVVCLAAVAWPVAGTELESLNVRYLGANGWAVTVGQRVLIFDYQQETDPSPPPRSERCLENGYINPAELEGYSVFVFATHAHFDHYSQAIFGWESQLSSITYLFGWEAGTNPEHIYFYAWRESAVVDGINVYTIYSHHSGVPEVAFLVLVDGLVIYHNGDYMADYESDFSYLRTITDHIDVAFVIGHPVVDHQYFRQTLRMAELFDIGYIFPMNREGEAYRCHEYAGLLAEQGVIAKILVAETRGEAFDVAR